MFKKIKTAFLFILFFCIALWLLIYRPLFLVVSDIHLSNNENDFVSSKLLFWHAVLNPASDAAASQNFNFIRKNLPLWLRYYIDHKAVESFPGLRQKILKKYALFWVPEENKQCAGLNLAINKVFKKENYDQLTQIEIKQLIALQPTPELQQLLRKNKYKISLNSL